MPTKPKKKTTYQGDIAQIVATNVEIVSRDLRKKVGVTITPEDAEALLSAINRALTACNEEIELVAASLGSKGIEKIFKVKN